MNQFDLKNRTAIITGGAQGFGFDIAKRFLNSGAKVIIWDIDKNELLKASNELNSTKLSYNIVDVSDYKQVKDTVNEIIKKSNIDILINNAGITGSTESLWNYDVLEWNKIVNINLMFLQSYAWIIGAFVSSLTYYLLAKNNSNEQV
jgi:3-oxoacyl-[acyl-carrier protein] reductase